MNRKTDSTSPIVNIYHTCLKFIQKSWKILVPVAIIFGLFVARMIQRQASLPELFNYVPANVQQVVVNRPARNIGNTQGVEITEIPAGVQAQFEQISLMLMVQVGEGTGEQLVLLESSNGFSPQDFLATLNPETEVSFTYKRLDNGRYIFGPKELISKYTKPIENAGFFANKELLHFTNIYRKYSMTIISRNSIALSIPSQFSQLFKNVNYLIMAVDTKKKDISFVSHVLYTTPMSISGTTFAPQFKEYLKASTIGYLELGPIASLLPDPEISASLTGDSLIQQAVIREITKELFQNHTALIVSKGSNPMNLGLTIASANPLLFTKLKPRVPVLGSWLQNQIWLTGSTFAPIETTNKIGYMITLPEQIQIGFFLEKDGKQTALRIGNPLLDGSSSQKLLYNSASLATLNIDADQFISIYKQFVNMGIGMNPVTQDTLESQFKGKSIRAHIFADEYGLGLAGEVK